MLSFCIDHQFNRCSCRLRKPQRRSCSNKFPPYHKMMSLKLTRTTKKRKFKLCKMNEKRLPQNKLPAEQDDSRPAPLFKRNLSTVFIETKENHFFRTGELCVIIRNGTFLFFWMNVKVDWIHPLTSDTHTHIKAKLTERKDYHFLVCLIRKISQERIKK